MSLKAKSFLVSKGSTLDSISEYLQSEIGLNAYLIKDIQAVPLNETVTQVTVLFNKYPDQIIDSIAPREGAIFGTGVSGADFDIRFLFNYPVDFGSISNGTFLIDNQSLDTTKVKVDQNSNNYFLKISADGPGFQDFAFHTYQASSSLKRIDGSSFPYTPVGGYIFNDLSSAHIGDYSKPLADRRRGKVSVGIVRLSKSVNPQQGILEYLSQKGINEDSLISYTSTSTSTNTNDVYFIYLSKIEPQIVSGFPLNNALLPQVSAPDKVTLVFNTKLDKTRLLSKPGLFTIESGFTTSVNVATNHITVLDDLKTVEINTSTYFTQEKVYSIIARPGILSIDGLEKEKPEQWTIHISAYESADIVITGGGTGGGAPTDASYLLAASNPFLSNAVTLSFKNRIIGYPPGSPGGTPGAYILSGVGIQESFDYYSGQITGHTGLTNNPHGTTAAQVGAPTISNYDFLSGQTLNIDLYLAGEIGLRATLTQYDFLSGQVTGHTGLVNNPHGTTAAQVGAPTIANHSFLSGQITGHTGLTNNPHATTAAQVGAPTTANYSFLSGVVTGHTGQVNNPHATTAAQVGAPTTANYSFLSGVVTGHTGLTNNPHATTAAQVGAPTTANYSFLSGVVTGHTGLTNNPHATTAAQVGAPTTANYSFLSGVVTGHTGRVDNPHSVTAAQVGAATTGQYNFLSGQHSGLRTDFTGLTGNPNIKDIRNLSLSVGEMLYYDGVALTSLDVPPVAAVLIFNPAAGTPAWLEIPEDTANYTLEADGPNDTISWVLK
jgi:hypothetical protein